MRRHSWNREPSELRPADGNSAVKRFAAVVVALRGAEYHRRMARRLVRKDIRAQKRDFGSTELVGEHHFGITAMALAEDDATGSTVTCIQFIDCHAYYFTIIPPFILTGI